MRASFTRGLLAYSLLGADAIHDQSNGWFYVHAPGIDEPLLAIKRAPTTYIMQARLQVVSDGMGQMLSIADSSGGFNSMYAGPDNYTPGTWATAGMTSHAQTFDPQRLSADSGAISSFRTRQYDPSTGSWLQEDHAGLAGGVNLYEYNGNDPNSFQDPFGDTLQTITVQQKNSGTRQAQRQLCVDKSVANGVQNIADEASAAGIPVVFVTAYRDRDTPAEGPHRFASPPGASEHLSGFAFDVSTEHLTKQQYGAFTAIAEAHGFKTGTDFGHFQSSRAEREAYDSHQAAVTEAKRSYNAGECRDAYVEGVRHQR